MLNQITEGAEPLNQKKMAALYAMGLEKKSFWRALQPHLEA